MSQATTAIGPRRAWGRGPSLAAVALAYVTALAGAMGAGALMGSAPPLLTVAIADLVGTLVIFIWSRSLNNSSMYDAYWSVVPPAVAVYFVVVADAGANGARQVLVLTVVWLWALRLTGNWARGWPGLHHEDWRYVEMRSGKAPYWISSLFALHLFPTVQVYLGCLALYPALVTSSSPVGVLDVIATVMAASGVVFELVADEQLRSFNRTKSPGDVCDEGIWAWSRHPNYLGEMLFWWGLWLFALAADAAWWWTVVGPLAMTAMFLGASIPMMERRSLTRRPAYAAYAERTPLLVPRPPRTG
jgi:steroid 5-alpha reductase family enzyme